MIVCWQKDHPFKMSAIFRAKPNLPMDSSKKLLILFKITNSILLGLQFITINYREKSICIDCEICADICKISECVKKIMEVKWLNWEGSIVNCLQNHFQNIKNIIIGKLKPQKIGCPKSKNHDLGNICLQFFDRSCW